MPIEWRPSNDGYGGANYFCGEIIIARIWEIDDNSGRWQISWKVPSSRIEKAVRINRLDAEYTVEIHFAEWLKKAGLTDQ